MSAPLGAHKIVAGLDQFARGAEAAQAREELVSVSNVAGDLLLTIDDRNRIHLDQIVGG